MGLFNFGSKKEATPSIPWVKLETIEQLDTIVEESKEKAVVIFKHSTRCSISSVALSRFQREWEENDTIPYYLDLIANRPISNAIADKFNVFHESPQAILIKDGSAIKHDSHNGIKFSDFKS